MKKLTTEEIENIITYEVIVDCYDDYEVNMGWAIYMTENISYPFEAECEVRKTGQPATWQKVSIIKNKTDESDFSGESFYVIAEINGIEVPVKLSELRNVDADETTMQTLQVWAHR